MTQVLHLVPGAPFGGAQRLTIDMAAQQRELGMHASILFLNECEEAQRAAEEANVPARSAGSGRGRIASMRRPAREAEVLHLHVPPPWLGPVLPRGPAKVLHLHVRPPVQVHEHTLRRDIDTIGERYLLGQMDHAIAISDWIAEAWTKQYPRRVPPISTVYNGIALPPPTPRPDGPFTIAIACRLSQVKGVEEFIAFAAEVHRRNPKIRFRIAGEGPARAEYEALALENGLGEALSFLGFVEDMAHFWARAHLAAFTPPFEPFGLRLIEPIAHGVPSIAFLNNSGSDEVVERCRGIEAVPYGETQALAELALAIAEDPDRLFRMAEEGRQDLRRHFSLEAMVDGINAVYQKALA